MIKKLRGKYTIIMKLIILGIICTLWCVSAEPNQCCKNGILTDDYCSNNVSTWMSEMCYFGFYNTTEYTYNKTEDKLFVYSDISVSTNRYCFSKMPIDNDTVAAVCRGSNVLWVVIMLLIKFVFNLTSVACIIVTVLVYVALSYLRDLLGNCILCTVLTFTVYLICSVIDFILNTGCVQDSTLQLSRTSIFFWLTVLSFEIWRLVKHVNFFTQKKYMLIFYILYGWGIPLVLLATTHIVHHIPGNHIKPFYGATCWYEDYHAWIIYFFAPVCSTILVSIVMFSLSGWTLWQRAKICTDKKFKSQRFKFLLCFTTFIVIMISWLSPVMITLLIPRADEYFWELRDYISSLEGIIVYLILVIFRKRVRHHLAQKRVCGCICLPARCGNVPEEECVELDEEEEELLSAQTPTTAHDYNNERLNSSGVI